MNIGSYSIDDYMDLVKSFHGAIAPGIIIGGYMVDLAMKNLDEGTLFDAICETHSCIPDAIQLLTPCTTGNGWLRIIDSGRFALSLYDKQCGKGVRVLIDHKKLECWPDIKTWFFRLKPKKEQNPLLLRDQIIDANIEILSLKKITVEKEYLSGNKRKGVIYICPVCEEAFPSSGEKLCTSCSKNIRYYNTGIEKTTRIKHALGIAGKKSID